MTRGTEPGALADELAIRNLLARVAQLADEGDLDDYLQLFTEDASWGGTGFPTRRGRAALREGAEERRASGLAGPGSLTRHAVSTSVVEVAGDRARARSLFHFYGATDGVPELRMIGVWEDELVRDGSAWKIAARSIVRDVAP